MKNSRALMALGLSLTIGCSTSHAAAINFGTGEYVTVRSCIPGATTPCDSISPVIQGAYGGSPGATSSSATTTLDGYGTATGSVSLSGAIGAPVLRASAISEPGARTNTNSLALQRYTYTGLDVATRTFGGTLTYSQTLSLSGVYVPGVGGGISAIIDVFTLPYDTIEVGDTAESNFQALFSDRRNLAGYASLGSDEFFDRVSTASGVGALGVTVTLNPGDSVWVWVLLQTPAVHGALIDSSDTLITAWDIAADLVPAAMTVSEPGTLAMIALGLLVAGRMRLGASSARRAG